ncbi:hypothetical protein DITRI_Ditri04bG0128600 [Diplodiscus trichospermus]
MSYNISVPDDSSFNMFDYHLLSDPPFPSLYDSTSEYNLQALLNSNQNQQNPVDQPPFPDQLFSGLLSSSPPTDMLENLSLCQTTQFPSLSFGRNSQNGYENFNSLNNCLEIKNEECQVDFDSAYSDVENVENYLQRSFSSNSFEGNPYVSFQPPFDPLMEPLNFQSQSLPEANFFAEQMRRASSTGDLESMKNVHTNQRSISTPFVIENSFLEEVPFKVGRYNPEERQEKISKYRAKRSQRNFNKTIKYACRKTLADSRPRIRGRFARNDEAVEIPKAACSTRDEDEDDLWAMQEVEDETIARGTFINNFSQHHFQYDHDCF